MVKIDKVYTRGGDLGRTSLVGGERVDKDSLRIEAYGTIDELNATLGLVATSLAGSAARDRLEPIVTRVQNELFNLGAALATPDEARRQSSPAIEERHVAALERDIDELNQGLPELRSFVLPGGGAVSAHLHLARTVCRRAERRLVTLARSGSVGDCDVSYVNRLSDALFVLGRWAAAKDQCAELLWQPDKT